MWLLIFIYFREKQKPGLYLHQAGNKLLNMLAIKLAVLVSQCPCANLLNCLRSIGTIVITTEIV